jgi:Mor family transcriptional regulator
MNMQNSILRRAAALHPTEVMEPFGTLMEQFGFDAVCSIVDYLGGATVYIPSKRTIFLKCLEKEARKEFEQLTYNKIHRKYGISERQMRRMMRES